MIGSSFAAYESCIPREETQRMLAKYLVEELKVLAAVHDVHLVGLMASSEALTGEIARRLRLPYSILPVEVVHLPDGKRTICGAISGGDDIAYIERVKNDLGLFVDPPSLSELKRNLLLRIRTNEGCLRWFREKHSMQGKTVFLIDSCLVSKVKTKTALECLARTNVKSIVPVAAFLNKEVFRGGTVPLQSGIFIQKFEEPESLRSFLEVIENLPTEKMDDYIGEKLQP